MDLPDKIKLGYQDIKIKRVKSDFFNPSDNSGTFSDLKSTLYIQEGLNRFEDINVFIHEVLHGILIQSGICGKGQVLEDDHHAEFVTNLLANGLVGLFRDNKPLLMTIYASLHEFVEGM